MKTAISALLSGTLIFSALATTAQGNSYASINPVAYSIGNTADKELASTEVNAAALSDFNKKHKAAADVMWTESGSLLSVYFTKDGVKKRSTYNEKGKLEYTVSYLTLEQAPRDVRNIITSQYAGVKIVQITEINRKGSTYHYVKFEDATSFFTVQILNGEVDLFETINK